MKSESPRILLAVVVLTALSLAACGSGSTTGQTTSGTPSGNSTATAQPTARPKPTVAPVVTQQFCQSALTVEEANQIMQPATPATTIEVQSTEGAFGVCRYTSAGAAAPVVSILVGYQLYTGPKPVPEASIEQWVGQSAGATDVTVTTKAPVSDVGDQAEFLAVHVTEDNQPFYADALYVIYGQVEFMCDDFHLNAIPDDATQQSALTQCGQHVAAAL